MLEAVEQNQNISQRWLAARLGIAVGLTNVYVKRLARKGYIKCVNARSNRFLYLITPRGLAEKTRLTYEYAAYSLRLFRETRQLFNQEMRRRLSFEHPRVAIYGTGEAAELAYLCLKELAIEPVAILDAGASRFLGMAVLPLGDHATVAYDVMIVASLDHPGALIARLLDAGVSEAKLCALRPSGGRPLPRAADRRSRSRQDR